MCNWWSYQTIRGITQFSYLFIHMYHHYWCTTQQPMPIKPGMVYTSLVFAQNTSHTITKPEKCLSPRRFCWRNRDVTWFPQIIDKCKHYFIFAIIKIHLYCAMKNCGNCPTTLRQMIENIPNHYTVSMMTHKGCVNEESIIGWSI